MLNKQHELLYFLASHQLSISSLTIMTIPPRHAVNPVQTPPAAATGGEGSGGSGGGDETASVVKKIVVANEMAAHI